MKKIPTILLKKAMSLLIVLICAFSAITNAQVTINGAGSYATISAAVTAASPGDIIEAAPGVYNENVLLNKNNLILRSSGGKAVTTIQGTYPGGNGTVMVASGTNGVTIGQPGKGFTMIGYGGPGPIETAALYLLGAHTNITIEDNDIRADGDAGLLSNFNAAIDGITIKGNMFTGQTFLGPNPGGCAFSTQADPGNNVPRQLVTMGGGAGVTLSKNVHFLNNTITGTAGGFNAEPACLTSGQGNTLVTIDVIGCTISGNTFAGITTRFGTSLRTRGPASSIFCNTFQNGGLGAGCDHIFFGGPAPLVGASPSTLAGIATANSFPSGGGYVAPGTGATFIIYRDLGRATAVATFLGGGNIAVATALAANCPVLNVNTGMTFQTIQSAINNPLTLNGHTIQVAAGTYAEDIIVNKSLTILGPNANIDPCTGLRVAEAIVKPSTIRIEPNTDGAIFRLGSGSGHIDVTIKGLTIDGSNPALGVGRMLNGVDVHTGAGIINSIGSFDANPGGYDVTMTVQNNIIQNLERYGVLADNVPSRPGVTGTDVSHNKIDNLPSGNVYGGGRGRGIAFEENVYGSATYNCITRVNVGWQDDNYNLPSPGAATVVSNNTISSYHRGIFHNLQYQNASDATISNNTISAESSNNSGTDFGVEIASIQSGVGATVTGNNVTGKTYGLLLWNCPTSATINVSGGVLTNNTTGILATENDPQFGAAAASNYGISGVTITGGTTGLKIEGNASVTTLTTSAFTGQSGDYIRLSNGSMDNQKIDATTCTFGGLTGGAATPTQNFAIEEKIHHNIEDKNVGFVTVKAMNAFVTDIVTATSTNNDYTRIRNAVELVANNWSINHKGTFDWTEANANASWALGNDDVANTGDDYSILLPANLNGITFTAPDGLGTATIHGPGDDPTVNLEGVIYADATGDNKNWTISNMIFDEFDLAIGMFNGPGGVDAYDGTTITNNRINIATDLNTVAAPADPNQNIGIHYSFGVNQTISNNTINIPGDGVSNGTNFSSTVGMQSNTSGGSVYNGLQITGNTINILNAQSANPQVVLGIWENAHGHTSNITISNNQFLNLAPGNNPLLNLQRAFRVTSHSGASSTVTYSGNTAKGANIGFQWISGSNFSAQMPVQMTGNSLNGNSIGMLVQSNGKALLTNNDFDDASDNTVDVQIQPGSIVTSGAGNQFAGDNYYIENLSSNALNISSDLFDQSNKFRISDRIYDALDNATSGLVTYDGINRYVSTPATGSADETIQRAVNASFNGDVIHVEVGTFNESVLVNKSITLRGPNNLISPNGGVRAPEAIITGGLSVDNSASRTLVIEGLSFQGVTSPMVYNGNAAGIIAADFTFRKNLVVNSSGQLAVDLGTATNSALVVLDDNSFVSMLGNAIQLNGGTGILNATVTNNSITGTGIAGINTNGISTSIFDGNTINNTVQQGIQVAGTTSNVTISNNVITNANTSNAADRGGIRLRGALLTGFVNITNNIISGSNNGIALPAPDDITGKTINVNNNNLSGNTKSINHFGSGNLNATCNWYGTTVSATVASLINGPVTYVPYLLNGTDNSPATGFQPVPGSCAGGVPKLSATINSVTVNANNDGNDDLGSFVVCNSTNNILFNSFTDQNGLTNPNLRVYQTFTANNVTVPFCNNCSATMAAFAGVTGTAALINPALPGTLTMRFRSWIDANTNGMVDPTELASDWIQYTMAVNPKPILRQTYNGVQVTANNDGVDDLGSFTICSSASENVFLTEITDVRGITPSSMVKVEQVVIKNNVTINTAADGIYPLGSIGPIPLGRTATLINPAMNGTVVIKRRAFYDANNNNMLDAGDCSGDWVVYTITLDGEAPVLAAAPADISVQCFADIPLMTTLTWTDNYSAGGTVFGQDAPLVGSACSGTITRTWNVMDACGNAAITRTQIITVNDNTAPVLAAAPAAVSVQCFADVPLMTSLTWTDNCSAGGSVTGVDGSLLGGACGGTITRTWNVMDACGNAAITRTQIITVHDNRAPSLTVPADAAAECSSVPAPGSASATDNCTASPTVTYMGQTITASPMYTAYNSARTTGNQNYGERLGMVFSASGSFIVSQLGAYDDGQNGLNLPITVGIVRESDGATMVGPVTMSGISDPLEGYYRVRSVTPVTLPAGNYIIVAVGYGNAEMNGNSNNGGPTTVFNSGGGLLTSLSSPYGGVGFGKPTTPFPTPSIFHAGTFKFRADITASCPNNYVLTRTWKAQDVCGNSSVKSQTILVSDNTPPVITATSIAGCYPTVAAAEAAALAATTAVDGCPGTITYAASTVGTCSAVVTVTATDGCGNQSSTNYNTRIDNTPPTILTGTIGSCYATVAAAQAAALAATTATDNCPGAITYAASTVGSCSAVVTVTATDVCGNQSSTTYNTRIDNTPPTFIRPADITILFSAPGIYNASPAVTGNPTSVLDNCPGSVTVSPTDGVGPVQCGNSLVITRIWTAIDGCGNTSSQVQTITVTDNNTDYIIYAKSEAKFGEQNYINGDVGVTNTNGKAEFKKYDVLDPFLVRAKNISVQLPSSVNNRDYSPATGGPNPPFQVHVVNPLSGNYTQTVNGPVPAGNYKELTIKKGITATINGSNYGKINIEEGAQVTFTSSNINMEEMKVGKGKKMGTTNVYFSVSAVVKVKDKVYVEEDSRINVGGPKVTFYLGDNKKDEEKFTVKGDDAEITLNIMIPNGKLSVEGGVDNCIMTGWFIIEKLESKGKNVTWNKYDCGAPFAPIAPTIITSKEEPIVEPVVTVAEKPVPFEVRAYPNPSSVSFSIVVKSPSLEPIMVKVMDMSGKVLSVISNVNKGSVINLGSELRGGTYIAEVTQGKNRQTIKLVKLN